MDLYEHTAMLSRVIVSIVLHDRRWHRARVCVLNVLGSLE